MCHTNGRSIKNMIGVVINRLVGMGLQSSFCASGTVVRGDVQILHSTMTKTCWQTLVTCMQQVTKDHLYHLLGVWDYYVMYRHRAKSVL